MIYGSDVYLQKNVYSVFRASDPPSVGFAQLSDVAMNLYGEGSPAPTPTIGIPAATVTSSNSASLAQLGQPGLSMLLCLAMVTLTLYDIL